MNVELTDPQITSLDSLDMALEYLNKLDVHVTDPDGKRHAWAEQSDDEPYGLVHAALRSALTSLGGEKFAAWTLENRAETGEGILTAINRWNNRS